MTEIETLLEAISCCKQEDCEHCPKQLDFCDELFVDMISIPVALVDMIEKELETIVIEKRKARTKKSTEDAARENVITHLGIIKTWASFALEHDLQFFTAKHLADIAQWAGDAFELLKNQEPEKERTMKIIRGTMAQAGRFQSKEDMDSVCELIEHRIWHTNRDGA